MNIHFKLHMSERQTPSEPPDHKYITQLKIPQMNEQSESKMLWNFEDNQSGKYQLLTSIKKNTTIINRRHDK